MKIEVAVEMYDRRIKGLKGAIKKGLLSAASRGVADIVGVVIPTTKVKPRLSLSGRKAPAVQPPVDRGLYKAGWRAGATPQGARIYHVNPMIAALVEEGVRAGSVRIGKAMLRALESWVHRHSLEDKNHTSKQIAWALAKAMQKTGIEGRHVLAREKERLGGFAQKEVKRFVMKHIEESKKG
jgi:hypothetical protein